MAQQKEILGMNVQRGYKGPAARLVELLDANERNYVGIVFYEQYRNHSALTNSLDGLMGFLQCPVARGITPLHSYGYEEGAFIYETGKCKSVAELIRQASDLGLSPGPRSGLELMTQTMEVLQGALRIAEEYAIFSHGGLTPWRLMIRPDGKLQIIGFAVPQVEVLDYKNNPNLVPSEDSFRYAPPERMEVDAMEDFSSDLFAVALIGFEMMTTRPMYDGSISAIQESAQRADVSMRLNQAMVSGWLDQYTHDFLERCLRLDVEDRFSSLSEAITAGKSLLRNQHLQGMSLFDLMSACSQQILRQSQDVEMLDAATAMFDRNALAPEILEMEAERKRQKLKEVTLGEPSVSKQNLVAEIPVEESSLTVDSDKAVPSANLLDLLRQSSISKPEMPEIKAPPPEKPKSGLQNDLLSALRSSVSKPVDMMIPNESVVSSSTTPVESSEIESSSSTGKSKAKSAKLASLFTAPARSNAVPETPSPEKTEPESETSSSSSPSVLPSKSTANKLASLLNAPKRSTQTAAVEKQPLENSIQEQPVSSIKEVSSVKDILMASLSESVQGKSDSSLIIEQPSRIQESQQKSSSVKQANNEPAPANQSVSKSESSPAFFPNVLEERLPVFGEALLDDDDDSATTIMTRPTPSAKTNNAPKKTEPSMEKQTSTVKSNRTSTEKNTKKSKESTKRNKTKAENPTLKRTAGVAESVSSSKNTEAPLKQETQEHLSTSVPLNSRQQFMDLQSLFDSPVPLRSNIPTVNAQKYKISLGSGRGSIKQVCSPEITVSQLVAILLLNRLLPLRMDLSGNITSCYRVLHKGKLTSGQRRLKSFERQSVMLGSVPSRTLLLPIEVHTSDGVTRFNSPVNWIVSMGSIIDYMVSWLRITSAGWTVYINDHRMDVHDVLFDVYAEGKPCTIILKQSKK